MSETRDIVEIIQDRADTMFDKEDDDSTVVILNKAAATIAALRAEVDAERAMREQSQSHHTACMAEACKLLGIDTREPRFKWVSLAIEGLSAERDGLREALYECEVMLRGARTLVVGTGATMGIYDTVLKQAQTALAAGQERDGAEGRGG